jgi:hydroxypyruvate isomerase
VTTLFEAINTFDMPGFLLAGTAAQCGLLDALVDDHLRLQYDVYHMARMGEDIEGFLTRHAARAGHVQFADVTGRGNRSVVAVEKIQFNRNPFRVFHE